jgi:thiamine-phosphate pyrophosphorylase
MLRCAITAGDEAAGASRERLLRKARRWAAEGVELVQLRDKWMGAGELVGVAREMVEICRDAGSRTRLLVNGRADVAVAAGADGVHLTAQAGELTAEQVRRVFAEAGMGRAVVSASCHSVDEARRAVGGGADVLVFGPVFEKRVEGQVVVRGLGLERLAEVCAMAGGVAVLAVGGVNAENAAACAAAGAAGVAGIRLFGEGNGVAAGRTRMGRGFAGVSGL